MADKQDYNRHNREYDEEQQKQHFQSWETFWGRPGYGAPREVLRPNNYDDDFEYSDDQKQNLATIAPSGAGLAMKLLERYSWPSLVRQYMYLGCSKRGTSSFYL